MIRHIVSWKLAEGDEPTKDQAFRDIWKALMPLATVVPGISEFSVSRNVAYADKNFDVVLVSEFASLEALEAYQVHPQHLAAAEVVKARVVARASIDVEV